MESLTENKPLLYSLVFSGGAITALASGTVPELTEQFELVELPTEVRDHRFILTRKLWGFSELLSRLFSVVYLTIIITPL